MILKSIQLTHFKNHGDSHFDFSDQINCICGKNGVGKTNLLDAIYYLSFTKSAVNAQDGLAVSHKENAFTVYGIYEGCVMAIRFEKGRSKTLKVDGQEPERMSDVIGKIPLVLVLPDDSLMIRESSDGRRKFFDGALSQFDKEYLKDLLRYNKLLKQRNHLFKQYDGRSVNYKLVETYDDQLIPLAKGIAKKRAALKDLFLPFLEKNYADLHSGVEKPSLHYKTQVKDDFEKVFRGNFEKDRMMQRTQLGCHRDDFEFLLDDRLIKTFGSQGQQKTFIIALKLALYDFLLDQKGEKPLLLLDDVFDKLDDSRIELLVDLLLDRERFGQVFITDARRDRSRELFKTTKDVKFIEMPNE